MCFVAKARHFSLYQATFNSKSFIQLTNTVYMYRIVLGRSITNLLLTPMEIYLEKWHKECAFLGFPAIPTGTTYK